jgi:predicted short-subunit dehydrogenase-like oxidoreductase (DUF2520 family)
MTYSKVSIIGSGNVATHLALTLENKGHFVNEIYSRNLANANKLVSKLYNTEVKENLDFSSSESEIYIISVSDDAIEVVAENLIIPPTGILVHTSGSMPMSVLNLSSCQNLGVFYPLQTFSRNKKVNFNEIPICIEATNKVTLAFIKNLASSISKKVVPIDSEQRMVLHIAAVLSCNFTNHLFTCSKEVLQKRNLNFDLLKPLIVETVNKALEIGPENSQTGPALRKDFETLDKHYNFLQYDRSLAEMYKIISQDIIDRSNY